MVDQPEYGTNRSYLIDSIPFRRSHKLPVIAEIEKLSIEQGLSAQQLAERYGVSKSTIIKARKLAGIRLASVPGRKTAPQNYRNKNPPYGFKVQDSRLVVNTQELRICRLIIELYDRRGWVTSDILRELKRQKLKTRRGKTEWDRSLVKTIYERWKRKI